MEIVLGCIGVLTVQNFVWLPVVSRCVVPDSGVDPGQGRGQLLAVKAATQAPLAVSMAAYQTRAIWTRVEPKSVIHWLIKKRSILFCQPELCRSFILSPPVSEEGVQDAG